MKKKNLFFVIVSVFVILVGSLFLFSNENESQGKEEPVTVTKNVDIYTATNLSDIINESSIVVKGKYSELIGTENMFRNPENLSEGDSDHYVEGRIYQFDISEVLHGVVYEESIPVIMHYSEEVNVEVEERDISEVVEVINPLFVEPEFGQEYILFLNYSNDVDSFFGPVEPYALLVNEENLENISPLFNEPENTIQPFQTDEGDVIEVYTPLSNIEEDPFNSMTLEQLIDAINE